MSRIVDVLKRRWWDVVESQWAQAALGEACLRLSQCCSNTQWSPPSPSTTTTTTTTTTTWMLEFTNNNITTQLSRTTTVATINHAMRSNTRQAIKGESSSLCKIKWNVLHITSPWSALLYYSSLLESRKNRVVKDGKIGENGRKVKWESLRGGRRGWRDGIIARVTAK